jgi:hypothetical protein
MRPSRWILSGSLMTLPVCAVAAAAQTAQPFSLQGSAIFVVPGGDAFADTKSGVGFEVQLRRNISLFSLGGGVQFSRHEIVAVDKKLNLIGAFLEPRYVFPRGSQYAPYASGRIAVFRQSLSAEGASGGATGGQVNAGGGILFRAGRNVNLDLGATFGLLQFGEYSVTFAEGGGFTSPSASGTNIVVRAGLAIGLGSAN